MRAFAAAVFLTVLVWRSSPAQTPFQFTDFQSTRDLALVKDARRAGKVLRLTPAENIKSGAAWFPDKLLLAPGFETTFQFRLTDQDRAHFGGADGFAFVLQTLGPSAIAGRGSSGGFAMADGRLNPRTRGIPRSLAVFFDTHRNKEDEDPSGNYIAICTNGDGYWPPRRLAYTIGLPVKLKDGKVHTARIAYKPPLLSIFLDNRPEPILTAAIDISSVLGPEGTGYVGFTASTGGGYQNHDILSWSFGAPQVDSNMSVVSSTIYFTPRECLPNRTLCTPDRATVEATAEGKYHVVLPANLEWGASIPNPGKRAVTISNSTGTACWNPQATTAHACTGPTGDATGPGKGLLTNAPAGSLIMKTHEGRTYFSLNGRPNSFATNEGYFEFDAELQ